MRGEAGVPLEFHCGIRNAGWLGSFQIEYSRDLRAVVARDGGHEFLEVLVVGARDVRALCGSRSPSAAPAR